MPFFSIILATFNRDKFILKAIESVIEQTNSNWELIIVDDGSTDNTKNIIEPYLKDTRINNKPLLLTYCKHLKIPYCLTWRNPIINTNSIGKEFGISRSLLFHDNPNSWIKIIGEIKEEKFLFIGNDFEITKFKELNVSKHIDYISYNTIEEACNLLDKVHTVLVNEGIILGLSQMKGISSILESDLNRNTNFLLT